MKDLRIEEERKEEAVLIFIDAIVVIASTC